MENNLIKNTPFSEYEARLKLLVLLYSLQALSMNHKVQLMLDTIFFNSKDKASITAFMAIRNQFMHNSDAKSLESCLSFLNGTETFIQNAYWTNKKNNQELLQYEITEKEKVLFKSWVSLASDVLGSFEKVFNRVIEERKVIKIDENKSITLNFPAKD